MYNDEVQWASEETRLNIRIEAAPKTARHFHCYVCGFDGIDELAARLGLTPIPNEGPGNWGLVLVDRNSGNAYEFAPRPPQPIPAEPAI